MQRYEQVAGLADAYLAQSKINLAELSSSSSAPCLIDSAISNYIETHRAGVRGKDSLVWNFDSPPSLDVSFALSL